MRVLANGALDWPDLGPPLLRRRTPQHSNLALRATGIKINNGVRGRGWGRGAGGH